MGTSLTKRSTRPTSQFIPHIKRSYYEGLSTEGGVLPHFKRPDSTTRDFHHNRRRYWSRVRSGNKADEESYKHQMSIGLKRFRSTSCFRLEQTADKIGIHW